jgi:hypothetical protein
MDREPTLGERLAAQARALRARRTAVPGWTAALAPVLERGRALPAPDQSLRRRAEVRVPPPTWDPGPQEPAWPAPLPVAVPGPVPAPVQGGPAPLRGDLRERLAPVVGPGAGRIGIHHDEHADRVAAAHGADAVTVGEEIYFRSGRFRPDQPEGFALLAHEAWHATEPGRTGGAAHRATALGAAEEERTALAHERGFLDGPASPPYRPSAPGAPYRAAPPPLSPSPVYAPPRRAGAPAAQPVPAARPMAAQPDRHQETPAQALDPSALRQAIREVLSVELRDEAARRLKADLAIELERGA